MPLAPQKGGGLTPLAPQNTIGSNALMLPTMLMANKNISMTAPSLVPHQPYPT